MLDMDENIVWNDFISYEDISFLNIGDLIKITFTPHSQKHFLYPDYDYYFPTYEGKLISYNPKNMDEMLILTSENEKVYCVNRCGTSGFMTAYFSRIR